MSTRLSVLTVSTAAVLAAPATSHALSGTADKACYTHVPNSRADTVTEPITVALTGGTPGGRYQIAASPAGGPLGGSGSVSGTFDAAGNGINQITNVFPPKTRIGPIKGQKIKLTATDFTAGVSDQPIGSVRITNLAVAASGKPDNPRKKRRVKVSGGAFAKKRVFGFVTNRSGKKVLDRFKLGKANGCGFTARKVVVAPSPFRFGTFRLYVNAGKKLKRKRALRTNFRIFRRSF